MDEQFIYFDGSEERQQVIEQVQEVRSTVLHLASQVPQPDHYLPRYDGVSLAVMLAHLQAFDTGALWLIKAASNGYTLQVPTRFIKTLDSMVCRLSKQRLVSVTVKGIRQKETEICAFIRHVPLDSLSNPVCSPNRHEPYTVEKALQAYFVHYWQQQLSVLKQIDGAVGEL